MATFNLNQIKGKVGKALSTASNVANKVLPKTYSGNIIGNLGNQLQSQAGYAMSRLTPNASAQVKGASTSNPYGFTAQNNSLNMPGFQQGYANLSTGGSGGGGVSGGGGSPQQGQVTFDQAFNAGEPEMASIDYDALIRPALDALEGSIGPLQQGFTEYEGQQGNIKQTQLAQNTQNVEQQRGTLETSRKKQTGMAESAIDEARRQFSEIQQGLQARYGGTTGTGAFAGEFAGGQTLRNIANIRTGLATAMQEIDDKIVQIKSIGDIQARDIEDKTNDRILQAKQNMEAQVADIRRQQGLLQAQKAQMTAEAIQQYQTSVNQFKANQQQFLQQLYVQQTQAEQALQAAKQRGQGVAESFRLYNLNQGGINTPVRIGNQGTVQGVGGATAPTIGPGSTVFDVGTQPAKKEDDLDALINQALGG